VLSMFIVRFGFAGDNRWLDPTLAGLLVAAAAFGAVATLRKT